MEKQLSLKSSIRKKEENKQLADILDKDLSVISKCVTNVAQRTWFYFYS